MLCVQIVGAILRELLADPRFSRTIRMRAPSIESRAVNAGPTGTSEAGSPPSHTASRGKTWNDAIGEQEVAVPLSKLPPGLELSDSFPYPVRYDAQTKTLKYRGTMYHGSYVHLLAMSSDIEYARAIEQLFVASASLPESSRSRNRIALAIGIAVAVLVAAAVLLVSLGYLFSGSAS